MGHYFVVGLNHKTAAVELRERVHFHDRETEESLSKIVKLTSIDEVMIMSTCNRVELIGVCSRLDKIFDILTHFLAKIKKISIDDIEDCLYFYSNQETIGHVFRVASSLDSMIIGEPQILGQMKKAMKIAERAGTMGKELHLLLTEAFRVAKKIRTSTNIAANAVSVSFVAVELAKKILPNLSGSHIMVIGTGKMSTLTLQHLTNQIASGSLFITSRTLDHAENIASRFQGQVIPFEQRKDFLGQVDIIISSTTSRGYVLTVDDVAEIDRQGRPLFIIDIAVPRDIDPAIKNVQDMYLYDIDDLHDVANKNLKTRLEEAQKAEKLVLAEVSKFEKNLTVNLVKPLIISLQSRMNEIRSEELQRHGKELARMTERDRQFVEHLTNSLINRILHNPLCTLKTDLLFEKPLPPVKVIEKIFGLDNSDDSTCSEAGESEP